MKREISTVTVIKLWRVCWAGNIVCMKRIRNAHVILVGNLFESGHLARPGDGMAALRLSFARL
jgi:formate/nitrite transporter FocA (FNT family)